MPRRIRIGWKQFEEFLFAVGCVFDRERGDHRMYTRAGLKRPIVINRKNPLAPFVVENSLRLLEISYEEFEAMIRKL
ncbi:MAG: hypothetical protein A3D65_01970 [Candidatus Lloydbacteria bacterium RIFCSPHIGHO2_02_FULL_50_13]|uniref:Addiction module toxin, HicA family n=1 Tax=Candidatus Lloydbacteria bacterium RIFCSPHIGHO2_02_FULL_50_13 TaxID=1798661 RepID=A0A1G2D5U9_9BACT|nr:MAG: hypothetical protein A3D65_01970 [Candidatus Lloydbacteria bacterium RIFCSPHIGHO2_02_FULL_50_13]